MAVSTPILELSRSAASMPFEIHTMEWIDKNRWQQNSVPHRHNYFVIVWVKHGTGIHLIDLTKFELQDCTVYCITPGQVHLLNINGPVDGYVISFTAEFMGDVSVNKINVHERDALGIWNADSFSITSNEESHFLIIETPVNQK